MKFLTCTSEKRYRHPVDVASTAAGGRQKLAEMLDVKRTAIGNWKVRGIPAEHCQAIVRITCGAVSLQELRPNDWADYWPDLVQVTALSSHPLSPACTNGVTPAPACVCVPAAVAKQQPGAFSSI